MLTRGLGEKSSQALESYKKDRGLEGLQKVLALSPKAVIQEIQESGLTGRGGAGFPTGVKLASAAQEKRFPKYLICNADEGEPGTQKDRVLLNGKPWMLLEGMLIAAYAIGAEKAILYINGNYAETLIIWKKLLGQAKQAGLLGENILEQSFSLDLEVVKGQGPYIAGEEMALIASLEARRPMSRAKPPYPSKLGLFGQPTVVSNVETLCNLSLILSQGAKAYRDRGSPEEPGTRLFTLSGDVKRPGVYELALGSMTLRQLITELGQGTSHGRPIKAVQPGGGSSALLSGSSLDCLLTAKALGEEGSSLGTAGVIVYEQGQDAVDIAAGLMDFFVKESCEKCLPCRIGVRRMHEVLVRLRKGRGEPEDLERLKKIGKVATSLSLCGLGQTFPLPVLSALKLFPKEFEARLGSSSGKNKK